MQYLFLTNHFIYSLLNKKKFKFNLSSEEVFMLPLQLFINWQRCMTYNLFATANLIQKNLQEQTDFFLDNILECPKSEKIFFNNLFDIQKEINQKLESIIESNFQIFSQLLFNEETTITQKLPETEETKDSSSVNKVSQTEQSNTKKIEHKKSTSNNRYGKTKKNKTPYKTKKGEKKER